MAHVPVHKFLDFINQQVGRIKNSKRVHSGNEHSIVFHFEQWLLKIKLIFTRMATP